MVDQYVCIFGQNFDAISWLKTWKYLWFFCKAVSSFFRGEKKMFEIFINNAREG